jgi:hypothetical protein
MLISVRQEGVTLERLPLAFRKLNSFLISDVDGMARLVSRLSSAASSLKQMQIKEEERREAQRKGLPTDLELAQQMEKERREKERLEAQLIASRRRERERREKERLEAELAAAERKERVRREEEELEARLAEMQRFEERERQEKERLEAQQLEAERTDKERQDREFQEQLAEAQHRERERQEREFQEQLAEAKRKERERQEQELFQAQLAEVQRQERERQERERLEAELAEAQRRERERQDLERVEALRVEVERRERERREREWVEAQLAEVQRKERGRQEQERHERERLEAQLMELQRRESKAPSLVPVGDWQPAALAQAQAGSWRPVGEPAPAAWNMAEVSNGHAIGYAPPPLPYPVSGGSVSAARALAPPRETYASETVLFMHEVPERMWLGEPVLVRVCLGRGTIAGFSRAFAARAGLDLEGDPVAETVSMSLYGRGDVFEIERQSERVQLLPSNHLLDSPLELADYGRWVWHVTPLIHGEHELFLRVSALFRDRRGVPTPVALPDQKVDCVVAASSGSSIIQSLAGWLRR